MYCVYLIVNENGCKYIGYTSNLKQRVENHNKGLNTSTKGHKWKLVYAEAYLDEEDARKRERKLKYHGQSKYHVYNRASESIKKAECWEDAVEGGVDD